MIERYAHTPLTHTKGPAWGLDSMSDYGEAVGASTIIQGKVEQSFRRVQDAHGTEHQTQFNIFTTSEVRVGDKLAMTLSGGEPMEVFGAVPVEDLAGVPRYWDVTC